jgi:hypothetical protein
MSDIQKIIQKCIDQAFEIKKLKQQLADANKKLATNKENDRVAEYHRQWEKELKLKGEG